MKPNTSPLPQPGFDDFVRPAWRPKLSTQCFAQLLNNPGVFAVWHAEYLRLGVG